MTTDIVKRDLTVELDEIRIDVQLSERQIAALPPADRWALEETAETIRDVVRDLNDAELRRWVEEGKTQTWIAERVGRSTSQISRRCQRLGIRSSDPRGRPAISPRGNSGPTPDDSELELVEGEVVNPDPTPIRPVAGKVPCPTCGHPVEVSVLAGE